MTLILKSFQTGQRMSERWPALFSVELKLQKEKVADVAKAKNNKLTSLVQAQQMAPNKRHIFALISNRFMFPA